MEATFYTLLTCTGYSTSLYVSFLSTPEVLGILKNNRSLAEDKLLHNILFKHMQTFSVSFTSFPPQVT